MNRIDISYGGQWYSIGNRTLDEVHQEIQEGVAAGQHWLAVNDGEGSPRPAYLFITPGVPIAVIPVPEPQDPPTDSQAPAFDDPDPDGLPPFWRGPRIHPDRQRSV